MDRVRFGRALGFGARAAAKTVMQAANAVASPAPNATAKPAPAQTPPATSQPAPRSKPRAGNVATASSRMGRAVLEPMKRHSREVWLEVTGSFFALLALAMSSGMWRLHSAVGTALHAAHTNRAALWSQDMLEFYLAVGAVLMFTYFAVSNFVRASRSAARYNAEQQHR